MSIISRIEWTDATWNPVRGCTKVSPGCKGCYAERQAERFRDVPGHAYERGFDVRLAPDMLTKPLKWTKSKCIFVNSMSDLFHPAVSDDYIVATVKVMAAATWHTFQVLTKRSERMRELLNSKLKFAAKLPHIWWGVSVENVRHGIPRIDELRKAEVAVRFLSIEPLLENLGELDLSDIHWVIVGGESGPEARAMERSWVEDIRKQCRSATIPFFFKQWGGVHKKTNGRTLNGRTYDAMPRRQPSPVPKRRERLAMAIKYESEVAARFANAPMFPIETLCSRRKLRCE